MTCWPDTWPQNYVLAIFMWMLCRNPCACHAKSTCPRPWFCSGFGFQIALAPAWCKFCGAQLQKVARHCQSFAILTSEPLSCHSVVQTLATSSAADPPRPPVFRSWLSEPAEPQNIKKNTRPNLISHISAVSHLRDHISLLTDLGRQFSV